MWHDTERTMRPDAYTACIPHLLDYCNTMCTFCDACKVRAETILSSPTSPAFLTCVSHPLFLGMSVTNSILFLHISLRRCVLLRWPERILAPIPTLSSKQSTIAEDRHSYRVSLECQYSLNPRSDSLRVTAHTIDPPQKRVKEVQVRFENRCRRRG